MSEKGHNLLNYRDTKAKGLSSRAIKSITFPDNGASFTCGSTINLNIGGNGGNVGQYLDPAQSFLRIRVTNNNASPVTLDQSAYALFNRLLITSAGQTFQDLQQYNVLHNILTSLNVGDNYLHNTGRLLMGTHNSGDDSYFKGEEIAAGDSASFCLPLMLNVLSDSSPYRLLPLFSRSPIQMKLTLENADVAFVNSVDAAISNANINVDQVEFHQQIVQLNEQAQNMVAKLTNNQYNILTTEHVNFQTTIANGVNALSFPLGLSRSAVSRVFFCMRPQTSTTSHFAHSISNRAKANLDHIRLVVGSQSIPSRRLEVGANGGSSNAIAEYLISNHSLSDTSHMSALFYAGAVATDNFSLANGAGNASNNVGSFVTAIECESIAHESDKLYTSLNTIGQPVFIEAGFDTVPENMVCDVFAQNVIMLSMDGNGSQVFQVSV